MNSKGRVYLKAGREKSVQKKHPWVFSGGVQNVEGDPSPGDIVTVYSKDKTFQAYAFYNPLSQIRLRILSTNEDEKIDADFWHRKIKAAYLERVKQGIFAPSSTDCARIIFSESDGIPGIIADMYAKYIVVQVLTAGADKIKNLIAEIISEVTGIKNIYERSDTEERKLEGLPSFKGELIGSMPDGDIEIMENGIKYLVDIKEGHKTGFYLDQRDNRKLLREYCKDKNILNCFSYTGGFSLNALFAGAASSVVSIDSSKKAIEAARRNAQINGFDENKCTWIAEDAFLFLRKIVNDGQKFDVIVLDPPKFAQSAGNIDKALRGYKDINLLGLKLLNPGGFLFTFSCSGNISSESFSKALAWAALDAETDAKIIRRMSQGPDHPTLLSFPESEYLKGLVIQTADLS